MKTETNDTYSELRRVLELAAEQAAAGKGKERHASEGERFEHQQIVRLGYWSGNIGFQIGQASKKAMEAQRLPAQRAIAELLGAINYAAAAVLVIEQLAASGKWTGEPSLSPIDEAKQVLFEAFTIESDDPDRFVRTVVSAMEHQLAARAVHGPAAVEETPERAEFALCCGGATDPDGLPVHSFRSLLDDLTTLCKNQVRSPGTADTFDLLTTPTHLQQHALNLLGVPLSV